jgi:hypothetical protein
MMWRVIFTSNLSVHERSEQQHLCGKYSQVVSYLTKGVAARRQRPARRCGLEDVAPMSSARCAVTEGGDDSGVAATSAQVPRYAPASRLALATTRQIFSPAMTGGGAPGP